MCARSIWKTSHAPPEKTPYLTLRTHRRIRLRVSSAETRASKTTTLISAISWRAIFTGQRIRWWISTIWARETARTPTRRFQRRTSITTSWSRRHPSRSESESWERLRAGPRERTRTLAAVWLTHLRISRSFNQHFYLEAEIEEAAMKLLITWNRWRETATLSATRRHQLSAVERPTATFQTDCLDSAAEADPLSTERFQSHRVAITAPL